VIHNFNLEIGGKKVGVTVNKKSYWGTYKMAAKPFTTETINAAADLSYAYYTLTHNRKIQEDLLLGKSIKL
jgi:hypothetical protein